MLKMVDSSLKQCLVIVARNMLKSVPNHYISSSSTLSRVPTSLIYVTCSAILALLDKDDDLRARHELLNTERILKIFQIGAEI